MRLTAGLLFVASFLLGATGCQDVQIPFINSAPAAEVAPPPVVCNNAPDHDAVAQDLLTAINAERTKRKLPPLRTSTTLMQVADFYSCRLIDGRFFDHVDPFDGSTVDTRVTDFGYAFQKVGENLAAGHKTAKDAINAWLDSPAHRANLLDPSFTETGIAVKTGGDYGWYWVQEFGKPTATSHPTTAPETSTAPAGPNSN
jgi:uncharacterized protein YkwD